MSLEFDRSLQVTYRVADEVLPGIRRVVAENPGPFTFLGTATFIVGTGEVAVIDPGPADEAHIDALLAAVGDERISHILITHTHPDHSPGASLLKERTGAKVYGFGPHPSDDGYVERYGYETAVDREKARKDSEEKAAATTAEDAATDPKSSEEHGDQAFAPDVLLAHGELLSGPGWTTEAIHTPGHLANHLCFALGDGTLFTGDHVMGWSTSVISPPGGNLSDYLASMALLLERPDRVYVPTHGSPIPNPHDFVRGLVAHRADRTAQVIDQLRLGVTTIPDIVDALYVGLDARLEKAAGRSVLAHLLDLVRRGDVTERITNELETVGAPPDSTAADLENYPRVSATFSLV